MDKYDKLKEIKELFDNGLLDQKEFINIKKQILFNDKAESENDSELHQEYVSDYREKSEISKKSSTLATIIYIIIGIVLFAFVKKTLFKTESYVTTPITTEDNGNPKEINSNEYSKGLYDNGNQNNNNYQNSNSYQMGNDGRVYENNACSLCKGTGLETGRNIATGEVEGRICPMCDGRGVRSY